MELGWDVFQKRPSQAEPQVHWKTHKVAEQVIIPTRGGSPRAARVQFFQRVRAITGARRIWQLANAVIESICVLHGNIEPWLWWVCARTAQVQTAADNMLSSCCNPSFANSLNPPYAAISN